MRGHCGNIVKRVQFISDITTRKQRSCTSFAITEVTYGTCEAHVTVKGGQIRPALRQGVDLHRAREIRFFCSKLLPGKRIHGFLCQTIQRGRKKIDEAGIVGVRDVLFGIQVNSRDYVVEEGKVGVAQHTLVIPDHGLCLVGAEVCDVGCRGGDAVVTDGGGDVTAAEEESLDLIGVSEGDVGEEEALVEGGVGDEGREEELQVGLVCCVGLVKWSIICAGMCAVYRSCCFTCNGHQGEEKEE